MQENRKSNWFPQPPRSSSSSISASVSEKLKYKKSCRSKKKNKKPLCILFWLTVKMSLVFSKCKMSGLMSLTRRIGFNDSNIFWISYRWFGGKLKIKDLGKEIVFFWIIQQDDRCKNPIKITSKKVVKIWLSSDFNFYREKDVFGFLIPLALQFSLVFVFWAQGSPKFQTFLKV